MIRSKKSKCKKLLFGLTCVIICAQMLTAPLTLYAARSDDTFFYDRESYYRELREKGFPDDYARKLAELKLIHPTWSFEPLLVSELEPSYTFDYIIEKESVDPSLNLIYPSAEYKAYRDKNDKTLYDSGWYSASDDAIRYFIDPRNFLNERDIFQFEDITYRERDHGESVARVLEGTFMESLVLESGIALDEFLVLVGEELSLDPVFIASRLRQEQGTQNTSGMISGECGELLYYFYKNKIYMTSDGVLINTPSTGYTRDELLSYNGYYNFFNSGASGTGMFYIYLGAMKRAQRGTPEMAERFGGDGSWNSMEKSLYGGAYAIKKTYVDDYQNTLYLQKFNVDPRSSRNFWGQYMQNSAAALTEGRRAYHAYKDAGVLEEGFHFLIPVYSGMQGTCDDPADGGSPVSPSGALYSYVTHTDYPKMQTVDGAESRVSLKSVSKAAMRLQGWSVHSYGTKYYEISIDGGEFYPILSYPRADVREKYGDSYPASYNTNAYLVDLDLSKLSDGDHTIVIRAKTIEDSYYQVSCTKFLLERIRGDVDGDGRLSDSDVMALVRYLSGDDVSFFADADIDENGVINNRDIAYLIKIIKGYND